MRLAAILALVLVPVTAYAAGSEHADKASLILDGFTAAMQVYLASKLPGIDKRLTAVESDVKHFIEGVVR